MKKKILVIDDEELLTRTFTKLLEMKGFDVFVAKKGADALEIAAEENFDLIISDVRMPGLDGIETMILLKKMIEGKKESCPPVIFITGYADIEKEEKARRLSPAGYIMKPFDVSSLLAKINEVLG